LYRSMSTKSWSAICFPFSPSLVFFISIAIFSLFIKKSMREDFPA